MPLQNRVQPDGTFLAHPARGHFMGNRGILHNDDKTLSHRRWRHQAWVTCLLAFKNRKRSLMQPGHYTELFFHDEAVALASGHRPCGECRRAAYLNYRAACGVPGPVAALDRALHAARAVPRQFGQRRHKASINDLPDASFILAGDNQPHLVLGDALYPFSPDGYADAIARPRDVETIVVTPEPSLAALRNGYQAQIVLPD